MNHSLRSILPMAAAQLEQLSKFSTCEIADALLKAGKKPWGGYIPDLNMWSPDYCQGETRIVGPAYTVQMVSVDDEKAPKLDRHYVDTAPKGSVIVIAAPPDIKSAVWGGLMSARAQALGVKGVVIDGRVRDLNEQRNMKFPVFAKSHSTLPQKAFARPSEIQIAVTMSTSPVTVTPGDIIVADLDGVISVPADLLDKVIANCEKHVSIDNKCMEALREGASIDETFAKYRG